ncbi:MAG: RNA polymerase factor sigma-54 [Treponema sp.]|jgi:RNA polymerase sigma-54 factor|nr:RNA polymerase factor sigma-54 [Treponema sp.]
MQASLVQKQQLGVKMSPQVYQSIKLMEMPLIDLRARIGEELERNPALEILEDNSTISLDDTDSPREEEEYFETSSDSGFIHSGTGGAAASDDHHRFIEGALSRPETLQQHLLWQLQLEPADNELRAIAATLIQNLDNDGFHKEPPETLFKSNTSSETERPPRVDEAISLVHTLDPLGCCTADYHESLKVQIALLYNDAPGCIECALEHLELLEREKFSEAAKKMNCSKDEARVCFELIKKLSPFPGRLFAAADVRFVVPDLQVVRGGSGGDGVTSGVAGNYDSGDFVIIINNEVIPVLGINPFFKKLDPKIRRGRIKNSADYAVQKFARENIREARGFINLLAMRNHTLMMVARAIVKFQQSFFLQGPQHLVPLTLSDIAGDLGIHETTVSRTANGKYMQTEWGIFELRYFFTNSISGTGSEGSRFSKEGVKAIIQELVSADQQNLSDLDISGLLAQRGISLARRTVAKYRKELDLGSSYTR